MWTVESWASGLGWATIVFTAAAALSGSIAFFLSEKASAVKDREMLVLRDKAAKSEQELLKLQEKLKPRSVSPEQRARLVPALREIDPKGTLAVAAVSGDWESSSLASQFIDALKEAGWTVTPINMLGVAGYGMALIPKDPDNAPGYVSKVAAAFTSAGIPLVVQTDAKLAAFTAEPAVLTVLSKQP